MQQIKAHRTFSRRRAWPLAIVAGGVALAGLPTGTQAASTCTDASCPTDFIQLTSPEIQSTKSSFKFQARISQAKLPVDDVTFPKVIVKLRDGVNTWCSQTVPQVKVRDSVLNLEVGPETGMTCTMPLEDIIAGKNGLGFQICINNEENCLKPIALSSVPYSVKSEYARRAQQAFEADVAAQAHYAHRIAADLDLLQSPTIGTGYYDFHTPVTALTIPGLNVPVSNKEGVMQWTPVASAEKKLNILLKTDANGAVPAAYTRLDELKLHAVVSKALGKLEVSEATNLKSTLDVTGVSTLNNTLTVAGATTINNTLTTKLAATMQATLQVNGATTLGTAVTATNLLTSNGAALFKSTLTSSGATTINNTLNATGLTTLSGGLAVTGAGNATTIGGTLGVSGATQIANSLTVNGANGNLDVTGTSTLTTLKVPNTGSATFDGPVTFNGSVNLPSTGGLSMATIAVSGTSLLSAQFGGATFGNPVAFNGSATFAGATFNNAVTFNNAGTFTGSLTVPVGGFEMGNSDNIVLGHSTNNVAAGVLGATIGGGGSFSSIFSAPNAIAASYGVISGGRGNTIGTSAFAGHVGGGQMNNVQGNESSIVGGSSNTIGNSAGDSVIAGGSGNTVNGGYSAISGGYICSAGGNYASVGGGHNNAADGNYSMVPGGSSNRTTGDNSFAAGSRAKSLATGAFTWSDSSISADFSNSTANSFKVRAVGGVGFYTNTAASTGVVLGSGSGAWAAVSDRNQKHDIKELDPGSVLKKLDTVPVASWRYKEEVGQPLHMGPMAQDFYAAFGLGADDKHIVTVDADGVALAAVKGVHAVTKEQRKELDKLEGEVKSLRDQNEALEARLAKLESAGTRGSAHGASMFGTFGFAGFAGFAGLGLVLVASRRRKDLP
jgi:hypothetical protein